MDYEVFLLSRIKEEHDHTGDNVHSVAMGLERTGGIVTALAGIIAVVFLAFATSKITFIKLFGIGMATAVVMDATVIRSTLVPAFMRLAGDANWWAPPFLRRVYDRYGIHDVDGTEVEGVLSEREPEPEPVPERQRTAPRERPLTVKRERPLRATSRQTTSKKAPAKKRPASKKAAKR
jgi:RND superfamily putative drug exporter